MYLVTADEMRAMDHRTISQFGIPGRVLMESAGRGATRFFSSIIPDIPRQFVGVMAGRGNNGGDGFVIARYLAAKGARVVVYLLSTKDRVHGDAAQNLRLLEPLGIPVMEITDESKFKARLSELRHVTIWIDAILGTGLDADVRGFFKEIISFMNGTGRPIFSVDIPSGLNSETGQPCGVCIKATATATFAYAKIGHMVYPGAGFSGKLEIVDIGIPPLIADSVAPRQHLITSRSVAENLPRRAPEAHKGAAGHLLVLAGSPGKTGAAAMTAMAAMRTGAGLVTLGVPESLNSILETLLLEVMTLPLADADGGFLNAASFDPIMAMSEKIDGIALGPGIGTAEETCALVHRLVQASRVPLIIDADGLNCLSRNVEVLEKAQCPIVLTPHPGEMARLTGMPIKDIQYDRISAARRFAESHGVHLVLKGARTIVAFPDGNVHVNPTGNAGMAAGGMGDVLSGILAGLIVQGTAPGTAARLAVFVHGAAADLLAESRAPVGFLASEVMDAVPEAMQRIKEQSDHTFMEPTIS